MPEIKDKNFVLVGVVTRASALIQQLVHRNLSHPAARGNHRLKVIHIYYYKLDVSGESLRSDLDSDIAEWTNK